MAMKTEQAVKNAGSARALAALLGISPIAAAGSQAKAIEAIAALSAARDAVVACHEELAKDHRRLGYGIYNVGPLDKPNNGDWGGTRPTRVTEEAHARPVRVA